MRIPAARPSCRMGVLALLLGFLLTGGDAARGADAPVARTSEAPSRRVIQTTLGPIEHEAVGLILPHEHLFTDLRGPAVEGYAQADVEDVARVMLPALLAAKQRGVSLLVECSSVGVGRNVAVLAELSRRSGLPVVVPTGVYTRAEFTPAAYDAMDESQLRAWMVDELTAGIEGSGVKAGFIKLACDATPLSESQLRHLRAAAKASLATGAAIAIHTPNGERAAELADVLEGEGLPLDRFIWVHAQSEPDAAYHQRLAARDVYLEFDGLRDGGETIPQHLKLVETLLAAGHLGRILVSHDAGWYQPGAPDGGEQVGFNVLTDAFIPALQVAGHDAATILAITRENPAQAFAMHGPLE